MGHTGLFTLFTCQPTKSYSCSRSGVNVRAHLLRQNFSRNFRSIRYIVAVSESTVGPLIGEHALFDLQVSIIAAWCILGLACHSLN